MNRKAAFLVIVVFVLGLALGGLSMHLAADRFGNGRGVRKDTPQVVEELTRVLVLTPDQQKQVTTILEDTRAKYQAIYEQYRPQMEQARQQGRQNIRAILTAEQLHKFEAHLQKIDEARKKRNAR